MARLKLYKELSHNVKNNVLVKLLDGDWGMAQQLG